MRRFPASGKIALLWGVLCVVFLSGCPRKITIYRVPPFWTPDITSVAVVPFRSAVANRKAGLIVSDQVASLLATNPAYKRVYNRSHYKDVVDESRLRMSSTDDPSVSRAFRQWGKAYAILVGVVTHYSATYRNEPKRIPIQRYNRKRQQSEIVGYKKYIHTRNEANVVANATLVRVSDGHALYSTGPVGGRCVSESSQNGAAPKLDPHACLMMATNQVVQKLAAHFGIVPMQVSVNPSKDFLTAGGPPYDNEWPVADEFRVADAKMFVVLRLPPACDRNRFRITIIRKGTQQDLETVDFVWKRSFPSSGQGFVFSPRKIAAEGGGPGEYQAKFYAGPEPAMVRDFKIVP